MSTLTIIKSKTHDGWLECRKTGIGSSEIASVMGLNPWETPYQLWRRKVGLEQPKEENMAMRLGHLLESAVAQLFAEETGCDIIKSSDGDWIAYRDSAPWRKASPDRLFWLAGKKHSIDNKGILECKTTQIEIDADNPPMHWFCQLQWQMGIMGLQHGALAWLTAGRSFGYREFNFNEDFFRWLCDDADKFWVDNVLAHNEPAMTNTADILAKYSSCTQGKSIEASSDQYAAVFRLKEYKEEKKQLDEKIAKEEEQIKLAMKDAESMTYMGDTLCTWRESRTTRKVDTKSLVEHLSARQLERYMINVPGSRRFVVK